MSIYSSDKPTIKVAKWHAPNGLSVSVGIWVHVRCWQCGHGLRLHARKCFLHDLTLKATSYAVFISKPARRKPYLYPLKSLQLFWPAIFLFKVEKSNFPFKSSIQFSLHFGAQQWPFLFKGHRTLCGDRIWDLKWISMDFVICQQEDRV